MKKTLFVGMLFLGSVLSSGTVSVQNPTGRNDNIVQYTSVLEISLKSAQLTQRLAKDYQYFGKGVNQKALGAEIRDATASFDRLMQKFNSYVSENKKLQRHLKMIQIAQEDFESIVAKRYTPDNMLLLMDLASVIFESTEHIVAAVERGVIVYKKDSNTRKLRLSAL